MDKLKLSMHDAAELAIICGRLAELMRRNDYDPRLDELQAHAHRVLEASELAADATS